MQCIADVNVLLPLLCGGHVAERSAYRWFEEREVGSIGWCLPIRLAILRHLSNSHIMGSATLEPERALDAWGRLAGDQRFFEDEGVPGGVEGLLRQNVAGRRPSPKLWTDAWLAALAEASGMEMVTFDRGFDRFALTALDVLEV